MRHRILVGVCGCALALWFAWPTARAQPQSASPIVIDGATLIDVVGGTSVLDSVVVIEGNRVSAAGPRASVRRPAAATVIDAKGKFVLPGLTDSHVHLRDWMPELFLAHGITSVLDVGNPIEWTMALREGVEDGHIRAPRIFTSGGIVDAAPTAGRGHRFIVQTPAAAIEAVTTLANRQVDAIKVYTHMTPELIRAAAEEAHKRNIPVVGHISIDARDAVLAGLDEIAHSTGIALALITDPAKKAAALKRGIPELLDAAHAEMDPAAFDEFIKLLLDRHVFIEPDIVTATKGIEPRSAEFQKEWRELLLNPNLSYIPGETLLRWEMLYPFDMENAAHVKVLHKGYENLRAFLRQYVKAGGKLLAASDTQHYVPPGITIQEELELMVGELGMSPLDAIRTATLNAGLFLRRTDLGAIKPGSLADIIVVRSDPLKDIRNIRTLDAVIVNGRVQDTTYHAEYRIPIPRPEGEGAGGNPRPVLTGVEPVVSVETTASDSTGLTLVVTGADFVPHCVVRFDGTPLKTTFKSRTRLEAEIPARLLRRVGTFGVTVFSPRPDGGESAPVQFIVKFRRVGEPAHTRPTPAK